MSFLSLSNEIILLIAQHLQSQNDLSALVRVNTRLSHLLKHTLYRYNLHHHSGHGILYAAKQGSISAVTQFIEVGYSAGDRPLHGEHCTPEGRGACWCPMKHPILDAAQYGHMDIVKYLLEAGSGLDFENNDRHTPMHLAAKNGFLPLVQFLLEKSGSNLPVENDTKSHYSPIQLAALGGHKHVVGYLLAHSECRRHHATISLAPAALCGDTALVLFLLEHGADINYQVIENQNLFEGPLYSPTALASAATHGHLALVKLLLDKGSDIDCKTSRGTPLCLAVKNNHEDVIEALVTRGADVSTDILRLAVLNYNKKALELLLANFEHGTCQINLLELAAREGDLETFKVLMDKGFDREEALVVAIQYDQERIVTFLLEQGTDPDVPSLDKRATSHALSSSRIGILETLLRHGAHIDPECLKRAQLFAPAHIVTLANKFPLLPIESSSKVSRPSPILFGHNLRMAPIPFRI